jgi:hypothetical protein
MRSLAFALVLLLVPAPAEAADCLKTLDEAKYVVDRAKVDLAVPGEQFYEDLKACNPTLAASITEYIRYTIHDQEAKAFTRNSNYVRLAYAIAWAIVALGAVLIYLRQRNLEQTIGELEDKLRKLDK